MRNKKKIVVLGAGLSGLSAAWHLKQKGIEAVIFEKEQEAGGLCRSKFIKGFTFDCDGHLLHFKDRGCFDFVRGLLDNNLIEHQRKAAVSFNNRYIPYPFQANLRHLPYPASQECLAGFLKARENAVKQKNHKHFLSWVHSTFGPGIARHFMVPYNTKFWTLPLQELSCEWLDGFVPVPSIKEVLRGGNRRFGYNAKFWYPKKGGIRQLPDALARGIKNITAGCEVTEIDVGKKRIKTSRGDSEAFDYLIYSLPLPEAPGLIKNMPVQIAANFKKLRWNSIFVLNLGLDRVGRQDTHWIYFPGKETCFFRIGFAHNFSPYAAPKGKTSLYAEVAYSKEMPLDKTYAAGQVKKHLSDAGIISKGSKLIAEDKNDISYGYPIYDSCYRLARKKAIGYLEEKGILCCGRYGSWKYMSMEDSILDGKRVAQAAGGLI